MNVNSALAKLKNFVRWPWQTRSTATEGMYPYRFDNFDLRQIGYVFVISAIVLPILLDAIVKLAFIGASPSKSTLNYINLMRSFLRLLSIVLGYVYIRTRKGQQLLSTGAVAFYFYIFITNLVAFVAGIFISLVGNLTSNTSTAINLIISIFADGSALACCLIYVPRFWLLLKATWRNNRYNFLFMLPIFMAIGIGLNVFAGYLQNLAYSGPSANQAGLNEGYHTWYNVILIIIFTIFVAPFIEEFATRHGIFQLCGNKIVGFIASFCFFAQMHITAANDWEHIISYFGGALALTITFTVFRYNVWASVGVHVAMNSAAVIWTLAIN